MTERVGRARLDGRLGIVACILAGLALPLAFAPFDFFPLAPLSVAVLFIVWTRVGARRAFLCGWVYGLACFGFGVFWIHESFQFNHIAIGWALFLTGLPSILRSSATEWVACGPWACPSGCSC